MSSFDPFEIEIDSEDFGPQDKEKWAMALGALYRLRRNFEVSDPHKDWEYDRLELAHQSVRVFWNIYRAYVVWAQDFIVGRYLVEEYPKLKEFLAERLDPDREDTDYYFEEVGTALGYNRQRESFDPLTDELVEFLESEAEVEVTPKIHRHLFNDMCNTTCADAWWAKNVQFAFYAVEAGERHPLFEPEPGAHGSPVLLRHARMLAVAHSRYLYGRGMRKLDAALEVGEAIGVSEPTLRNWERNLCKDEFTGFRHYCFEIAGCYESILGKRNRTESEINALLEIEPASFKFVDTVGMAELCLREIRQTDLAAVRELLRNAREPRGSAELPD